MSPSRDDVIKQDTSAAAAMYSGKANCINRTCPTIDNPLTDSVSASKTKYDGTICAV